MLGRAHYLHSTTYIFLPEAYTSIITCFHEEVANEAVQCWYDDSQHVFHIECPSELQGDTDTILGGLIESHISEVLTAMEQENATDHPSIRLFKEASLTTADGIPNPLAAETPLTAEAKSYQSHILRIPNAELQIQNKSKFSNPCVELHGLAEVPIELSGRIIQPDRKAARKLIQNGRICRMVCLDEDERSRIPRQTTIGEPSQAFARARLEPLDPEPFHIMFDKRINIEACPVKETETDAKSTMEWVDSVDKAGTLEPEEKQEMPKDTKELLIQRPRTTARARVPKGMVLEVGQDDAEPQAPDENDAPALAIPVSAFSSVHDNAQDHCGKVAKDTSRLSDDNALPGLDAQFSSVVSEQAKTATKTSEYPIVQDNFESYPKSYNRLDKIGLTSDPSIAAQLDLERRSQRQSVANWKASISARQRMAGSQVPSSSCGYPSPSQTPHGSQGHSGSVVALPHQSTQNPASDSTAPPSWTNRVVERTIDDFQKTVSSVSNLIDDESFPSLSRWQPLCPLKAGLVPRPGAQDTQAGQIVESLRAPPPQNHAWRRDTMRQQARPKRKARPRVVANNPELPLPDPIPPPRPSKQNLESPCTNNELGQLDSSSQTCQEQDSVADAKDGTPAMPCCFTSGRPKTCSHDFCWVLRTELESHDPNKSRLKVSIGMAVVHATRYETGLNGTFDQDEAETNLNSTDTSVETDFFPTLTQSLWDASIIHHVLKEIGTVTSRRFREIHFRQPSGKPLVLTIADPGKAIDSIILPGEVKASAVLHYPTHTWDAQMTSRGPDSAMPTNEDMDLFVASMETIPKTSSFKAMVKGACFPHAAYAKHVYSLELEGLSFQLSQVLEYKLLNAADGRHNFAAFAGRPPGWELTGESDMSRLSAFLEYVDSLVAAVDVVGLGNDGLKTKKKKKKDEDDDEEFREEMYGRQSLKSEPANRTTIWW